MRMLKQEVSDWNAAVYNSNFSFNSYNTLSHAVDKSYWQPIRVR